MKILRTFLLAIGLAATAWAADVTPESLVGQPLPKLAGLNFLGNRVDFEGKPAIVEFWATWCPPCRESIPHLNEVYKKYGAKGLQIVGITDEPAQTIRNFMKKTPIDYPVATARPRLIESFGVSGIPHAFLVDKEGTIVWQGHPMELTDSEIEKVL